MKTPIALMAMITMNASALPYPDAVCRPYLVGDSGYSVSLVRTNDGYNGQLQENKIYGEIAMFRGPVKLEAYKESESPCKVRVTNPIVKCNDDRCVGVNSFVLEVSDTNGTKLLSVGGKRVGEPGSTMECRFSPRFLADIQVLCSAI